MTDNIIKIPELAVVMLVGTSGSGKSSFAKKHFKTTEVISSDYCRGLVSDNENDQASTNDAFDVLQFIAAKRLANSKLTVIDATNVSPEARKSIVELAKKYHVLVVAIVFNLPKAICHERNQQRPDRQFGRHVVEKQNEQLYRSLNKLQKEGISKVFTLNSIEEVNNAVIEYTPLWNNLKHEKGPFDIIGDVHGCFDELYELINNLGYKIEKAGDQYNIKHPQNRKIILVGDLVDRGPKTPEVLRLAMDLVESGSGFCVNGNHDDKLKRKLQGRDVKIAHGLAESLAQLDLESNEFKKKVISFLDGLISHYVFDEGNLSVAHAGIKSHYIGRASTRIRDFCMYGETTGEIDQFGLPVRYHWAKEYRGKTMIVYGHTPVPEAEWLNNTINIDTGCVFGGKLTALRYPEKEMVSVQAKTIYCIPVRAINQEAETKAENNILNIDDVCGKRIIETCLQKKVIIQKENACAALETMSRFAIDQRWLVYLPPTMSPPETSKKEGILEHPEEALNYYKNMKIETVICQEKHMGSRAIIVVCKDIESAERCFGVSDQKIGVCYTRTGRSFFNDIKLEQEFLNRVSEVITKAKLWDELNSSWLCLDCEILPWSAKAMALIEQQYAPVGAAASNVLPEVVALMENIKDKIEGIDKLQSKFKDKLEMVSRYQDAYRNYCWPVESLADYQVAPFHILASENNFNMDKNHLWHMKIIDQLSDTDPSFFKKTAYMLVELENQESYQKAIKWWEDVTEAGCEGMVVKPLEFTVTGNKGLIQPGIKCRGKEYLRIIYGPEYNAAENIVRLRDRNISKKRTLAINEYALGYEALKRFVNKEPLYRVHEAVFGVLALESDPVDPRL